MVNNTILPKSTLGNKRNTVHYHVVCKAAAASILWAGKEYTETNLTDILTNTLGWKIHHKLLPFVVYSV